MLQAIFHCRKLGPMLTALHQPCHAGDRARGSSIARPGGLHVLLPHRHHGRQGDRLHRACYPLGALAGGG